jgi:hypothetical protein
MLMIRSTPWSSPRWTSFPSTPYRSPQIIFLIYPFAEETGGYRLDKEVTLKMSLDQSILLQLDQRSIAANGKLKQ